MVREEDRRGRYIRNCYGGIGIEIVLEEIHNGGTTCNLGNSERQLTSYLTDWTTTKSIYLRD